jgi:hypothetical protein
LSEGFSIQSFGAASTVGAIANDMGRDAWSISGQSQSSQFGYNSGTLSTEQLADISNDGFVLTLRARVIQGLAPAYSPGTPIVIGGAQADFNGKRYEVQLGLDSVGDTVVVLPSSIDAGGPGQSIRAPGPSYTLIGSGSSYHTYQLVYDANSLSADLFVDGIQRIGSYSGHTSFVSDRGLVWAAHSGGQGNFDFVELVSPSAVIPEPSGFALIALGGLIAALLRRRNG